MERILRLCCTGRKQNSTCPGFAIAFHLGRLDNGLSAHQSPSLFPNETFPP
jgi:hypothetical protein